MDEVGGPRNLIIFDWDDTLFCSTWLCETRSNDSMATLDDLRRMEELGESIEKTLAIASKFGEVLIVTNAQEHWVELSTEYYMPNLVSSLAHYRVVSARSRYQSLAGNDPHLWKKYAFSAEITRFTRADDTGGSVFSIGDSSHERLALQSASDMLESQGRFSKSIKLMDRPHLDDLLNQQALVRIHFARLVQIGQSFDICIVEKPVAPKPQLRRATSLTDARPPQVAPGAWLKPSKQGPPKNVVPLQEPIQDGIRLPGKRLDGATGVFTPLDDLGNSMGQQNTQSPVTIKVEAA